MPDVDGILAHYGKKGMKWGVRKANRYPASEDSAKVSAIKTQAKKQGRHTLTNEQLRTANQRFEAEGKFAKGTAKPKSNLRKGAEAAVTAAIVAEGARQIKNLPKTTKKVKQLLDVVDWDHVLTKAG